MLSLKKITALFIVIFFLSGCQDKFVSIQHFTITPSENKTGSAEIIKDSLLNFSFSRLRIKSTDGFFTDYAMPVEHQNKVLRIIVSGNVRTNYAHSNAHIVFMGFDSGKEMITWRAVPLRYYFYEINKWSSFKDSIDLAPSTNGKYYNSIHVAASLGNSDNEFFDVDTLKIEFKEKLD